MYLKRYSVAAFFFMLVVGWYVYAFVNAGQTSLDLFGIQLPALPIALLVVVPIFVFFIATIGHMSFYSLKGYFKLRAYRKDYEKLLVTFQDRLLGKESNTSYKTPRYKLLGKLLENVSIYPSKEDIYIENEKLASIFKVYKDVKAGSVVDLKAYNLEKENALFEQNITNRYNENPEDYEWVLAASSKYPQALAQKAYLQLCQEGTAQLILKHNALMHKEALFALITRVNQAEKSFKITHENILNFIKEMNFDESEYVELSKAFKNDINPDERLKLIETLKENDDKATAAYLYTLFDLEMVSTAEEFLENTEKGEYERFKAFVDLKHANHHYNIELFV